MGLSCVVEEIEHIGHEAHVLELAEDVQAANHLGVDWVQKESPQKGRQISKLDPYNITKLNGMLVRGENM